MKFSVTRFNRVPPKKIHPSRYGVYTSKLTQRLATLDYKQGALTIHVSWNESIKNVAARIYAAQKTLDRYFHVDTRPDQGIIYVTKEQMVANGYTHR